MGPGAAAGVLTRSLAKFLGLAVVLGLLVAWQGQWVGQAFSPLFESELRALDRTFRVDRVSVDHDGPDPVFLLEVGLARPVSLNGQTFYPDPRGRATASTLVGNLTLPCVLLLAIALAWPVRNGRFLAIRTLVLVPTLLLLCALGVPLILWAGIWGVIIHAADPDRLSPLLLWRDFLLDGGTFALALTLGAAVGQIGAPSRPQKSRP